MIPRSARPKKPDLTEKLRQNGYDTKEVSFLEQTMSEYPDYRMLVGAKFAFRPPKTIVVGPLEPNAKLLFLHELSHAICGHYSFRLDIERLKMEVEAWEKARVLAKKYGVEVDEELIQAELDTYRDWLHKKSRCPRCGLTRFQTSDSLYHCPLCERL